MLDSSKKIFILYSVNDKKGNWILYTVVLHIMNFDFFINNESDMISEKSFSKFKLNILNIFLFVNNNDIKITEIINFLINWIKSDLSEL